VQLLRALGTLYTSGVAVDWNGLSPQGRFVPLPHYPWQRETCRWEPEAVAALRLGVAGSALLGDRGATPQPSWQVELTDGLVPYLKDHVVQGAVVLPGAAYVDAALSAQWNISNGTARVLEEVSFHRALVIGAHEQVSLRVEMDERSRSVHLYSRASGNGAGWTLHTSAKLSGAQPASPPKLNLAAIRERCRESIAPTDLYTRLHATGLQLGPTFRGVRALWRQPGEVLAEVELHPSLASDLAQSRLYPTLLDCGFQAIVGAVDADLQARSGVFVPVEIARVTCHESLGPRVWAHARLKSCTSEAIEGDIALCGEDGTVLAEIRGLHCRSLGNGNAARSDAELLARSLHAFRWEKAEQPPFHLEGGSNGQQRWLLLMDRGGAHEELARDLRDRGATCLSIECGDAEDCTQALAGARPASLKGIVDLRALDGGDARSDWVGPLPLVQALSNAGATPRLYLVTRGLHAIGDETTGLGALAHAPLWGLGRVVMNEHPELGCTLIDLPSNGELAPGALATELLANDAEDEVALRDTERFVHRLGRERLPDPASLQPARLPASHPFALEVGMAGSLESLRFRETERRAPEEGEVELQIRATALNFKDVLKVLGLLSDAVLEDTYYGHHLGMEATAMVVRAGPGVQAMTAGDEIVTCIRGGTFRSYVTVPVRELCWVPALPEYGHEDQAGMLVAFLTAFYSLRDVARLQRGERVLLHSAAGGVGLAAIQVARWCGAEIFVTGGSPEKRAYLYSLGIEHVMDSRSLDFADEVMAATGGAGVDVVLNFIPGEALTKSFSLLAPFGRFVEIGKQDIDRDQPLGLRPFNDNLTFSAVDVDRLLRHRFDVAQRVLRDVWRGLAEGYFQPLPFRAYPIGRVEDACRQMMNGSHTGKLVLTLENVEVDVLPLRPEVPLFTSDATYLMTGGLGGFGLAIAQWMVDAGAKNLVLLGRSGAATPEAQAAVRALEENGARVVVKAVDVGNGEQLAALLVEIAATLPPLRGVMHAAMVLDDGMLAEQTPERFRRVLAPKVDGALHLHRLTAGMELDFFVLFSSISSVVGNPGQGNYAAANAFLDALAHHRRGLGLPALSVNWGALAEVGVAARTPGLLQHLERIGIEPMTPARAVAGLARLMRSPLTQVAVVNADWQTWMQSHPAAARSPRFAELQTAAVASADAVDPLVYSLAALSDEGRTAEMISLVAAQIARVLRMRISKLDVDQPLTEMGVDSLLAVELRLAIQQGFGVEYSVLELLKGVSVSQLATQILGRMLIPNPVAAPTGTPSLPIADHAPPAVDALTDEQVDDMLIELLQGVPTGGETQWMR
jgi:NADPH:quinone reductase-like Zn-dependent oxidoreductase/NAD(P)-dependent dehydrogenase (short-subunit alcohol dehydrogenase family)